MLARKLRQRPFGVGSAVETVPLDERALDIGRRFCAASRITGLFEIELISDGAGELRMVEVNPRVWAQVLLPAVAGCNLLLEAYHSARGRPRTRELSYTPGVGWVRWKRDPRVVLSMLKHGRLGLRELVRSLLHVRAVE